MERIINHNSNNRFYYRIIETVWFIFSVVETILLFRFLLKFLGANPGATFTSVIYNISEPLVSPFLYVVPSSNLASGIVEWSTLVAVLVYWVITWGVIRLVDISRGPKRSQTVIVD